MRFSTDKSLFNRIWQTILSRKLLIFSVFLLVVASGMIATLLITPKQRGHRGRGRRFRPRQQSGAETRHVDEQSAPAR
jgi:hypothetical protein